MTLSIFRFTGSMSPGDLHHSAFLPVETMESKAQAMIRETTPCGFSAAHQVGGPEVGAAPWARGLPGT